MKINVSFISPALRVSVCFASGATFSTTTAGENFSLASFLHRGKKVLCIPGSGWLSLVTPNNEALDNTLGHQHRFFTTNAAVVLVPAPPLVRLRARFTRSPLMGNRSLSRITPRISTGSVAQISMDGSVKVLVTAPEAITSHRIRLLGYGIKGETIAKHAHLHHGATRKAADRGEQALQASPFRQPP